MTGHRPTLLHTILFLATCATTVTAGAMMEGVIPWETPERLTAGLPFAGSLMTILLTHEMGHYIMSRRHGTPASLPYFIPAPSLIGTFGAVIKMHSRILDRRALLDIGATGPLAGFVVAVVASAVGLSQSEVVPLAGGLPDGTLELGDSLLFKFLSHAILGIDSADHTVLLHPVAFAGWIGLLVTALNLIPVGQLDGGHICYALFGAEKHRTISNVTIPILLALGGLGLFRPDIFWPGWLLWGLLLIILGRKHPPVVLPFISLDPHRRMIGWISLGIFILTFIPVPFSGF